MPASGLAARCPPSVRRGRERRLPDRDSPPSRESSECCREPLVTVRRLSDLDFALKHDAHVKCGIARQIPAHAEKAHERPSVFLREADEDELRVERRPADTAPRHCDWDRDAAQGLQQSAPTPAWSPAMS